MELENGAGKAKILTSRPETPAERPRDRIFDYSLDRIASLRARAVLECREPSCGAKDEEGNVISCSSENCGEKRMMAGWRRELRVMRDVRELVEWLERSETAKADKGNRR